MMRAAEKALGCRPRRWTELVKQRLQELHKTIVQRQDWLGAQLEKQKSPLTWLETPSKETIQLEDEVVTLEAAYCTQGGPERKHCHLAKARRRLASIQMIGWGEHPD